VEETLQKENLPFPNSRLRAKISIIIRSLPEENPGGFFASLWNGYGLPEKDCWFGEWTAGKEHSHRAMGTRMTILQPGPPEAGKNYRTA
jgi:hypothetical protein